MVSPRSSFSHSSVMQSDRQLIRQITSHSFRSPSTEPLSILLRQASHRLRGFAGGEEGACGPGLGAQQEGQRSTPQLFLLQPSGCQALFCTPGQRAKTPALSGASFGAPPWFRSGAHVEGRVGRGSCGLTLQLGPGGIRGHLGTAWKRHAVLVPIYGSCS